MPGIVLNTSRKVRARDCFIMHMPHSSGQIMQRNVEFILRDEGIKDRGVLRDSEVLICEVPVIGRLEKWLLFQPIPLKSLSARTGDDVGEIVVMVRGRRGNDPEWREVMVLKTTNDIAAFEWVQMLGLLPVPPADPFEKFRVPAGEIAARESSENSGQDSRSSTPETVKGPTSPKLQAQTQLDKNGKSTDESRIGDTHSVSNESSASSQRSVTLSSRRNTITRKATKSASREPSVSPSSAEKTTAKARPVSMQDLPTRKNEGDERSEQSEHSRTVSMSSIASTVSTLKRSVAVGRVAGQKRRAKSVSSIASMSTQDRPTTPTEEVPTGDISRRLSGTKSDAKSGSTDVSRTQSKRSEGLSEIAEETQSQSDAVPAPVKDSQPKDTPPPVPPHRVLTPSMQKQDNNKLMPPPSLATDKLGRVKRRSSSPLKHEYEPSTASEGEDENEADVGYEDGSEDDCRDDAESEYYSESGSGSQSGSEMDSESASGSDSDDSGSENGDPHDYPEPTLEVDLNKKTVRNPGTPVADESLSVPKQRKPSSQASETTVTQPPPAVYKGLAHLFSWSANAWQKFHPDECKIVVTSGRVEAYPNIELPSSTSVNQATSSKTNGKSENEQADDASNGDSTGVTQPLVVNPDSLPPVLTLELSPTTPIRRGTAVDLSIRTPMNSKFCGNSVMFRCRTPGECEALYNAINSSRVFHSTYHPLPNVNKYHSYLDADGVSIHPPTVKRGWGSWGRSGYRANSSLAPSIISSEGSVGSLSSAFSALKRNGGKLFGLGRGSSGSSFGSFASESSAGSIAPGSLPGLVSGLPGVAGGPISMSGLKIRLYKPPCTRRK
ncbi:hypothetical protein BDZ91DRAFT_398150 [Kalaharituber pfeilii]|nr:hypothetical protein BDZ91DRAFT_398150 [Kalaharituber pfeilii]